MPKKSKKRHDQQQKTVGLSIILLYTFICMHGVCNACIHLHVCIKTNKQNQTTDF